MRYLKAVIPAILLSTMALNASAESGWYLGASVGNSELGFEEPDSSFDIDDSDTGYKLYTGLKFTVLAVEAGYVDFGSIGGDAGNVDLKGFDAFAMLSMGLGPVEVFGKLGGFVWDAEGSVTVSNVEATYEENGFDPAIGLGAAFNLGGMGVRAEYEFFDIGDFDKVSMLSVGATFWML